MDERLHERREQFEQLSAVESALFVLRVARPHVPLAPSEVHGLPENVLGRVIAEVFVGAGKQTYGVFICIYISLFVLRIRAYFTRIAYARTVRAKRSTIILGHLVTNSTARRQRFLDAVPNTRDEWF